MLIIGLLALGTFTAIVLVSFALAVVARAIITRLRQRGRSKGIIFPRRESDEIIKSVGQKNPTLAKRLSKSFHDDEDAKMEFEFDGNSICEVATIKAKDSSDDDITNVTNFYADGRIKQY
jgi:uncharacterized protein YkuJ